jgi:hypothetical protein
MKLTRNFDFCETCRLSYTYQIMLVDDNDELRVGGQPEDKCSTCNNCYDCCKCYILMIATDVNEARIKS